MDDASSFVDLEFWLLSMEPERSASVLGVVITYYVVSYALFVVLRAAGGLVLAWLRQVDRLISVVLFFCKGQHGAQTQTRTHVKT